MPVIFSTLSPDIAAAVLLFVLGFYCLLSTKNMVRMIIGLEIMARGATLSFVSYGFSHGNTSISQALVISIIVVEVVVTSIALALIMNVFKLSGSVNVDNLTKLKG